jgi:hypothetical protein
MYDGDVGRFLGVDPLAADYAAFTPYHYTLNNPIRFIDPDGRSVDDYFVFDENGRYIRTEENDQPDQIIVENSQSGVRKNIFFNDPKHDSKLFRNFLQFYQKDAVGKKLLFFISDRDVNEMMVESGINRKGAINRSVFTMLESVGGKMDFSVYHLPRYVALESNNEIFWQPSDLGIGVEGGEKRSPFFVLGNDRVTAYNWLDAGNWLWGNAVNRLGGSYKDADRWAKSYNKGDSFADLDAISNGWFYYAGFRSFRNVPKEKRN